MKRVLVTGGAGFIGSHLCDALIKDNFVVCVDDLSRGSLINLAGLNGNNRFVFCKADVSIREDIEHILEKNQIDTVYHLAANTDLWVSMNNPSIEDHSTFGTTLSLLQAMKAQNVKRLFFASTSAIYGQNKGCAFVENSELSPISYYGAAKMAAEAYIRAYAYMNDMSVLIYRFSNVIGKRMGHGVIHDFIARLLKDPTHLDVRGNGLQRKPYLHVSDLIPAILHFDLDKLSGVNIFNVGAITTSNVRYIAESVLREMQLNSIPINYEDRIGGWKSDVAYYEYNIDKIREYGWQPTLTSDETIRRAVHEIYDDLRGGKV